MRPLLKFADAVDWLDEQVGQTLKWLVLFASLISAGNALMRYTIHYSSNAFLEIQWYMFGAMFLLAAGYALKHGEHVRVDVFDVSGRMVKTVADRQFPAGPSPLYWDGTDNDGKQVARGVYFTQVKFRNRNFTDAKKLVVLK